MGVCFVTCFNSSLCLVFAFHLAEKKNIPVNGRTGKPLEKVHSPMPVEKNISVIGKMTKKMDKVPLHFLMEINMSVAGKTTNETEKVFILGLMVINILENLKMIKGKEKGL